MFQKVVKFVTQSIESETSEVKLCLTDSEMDEFVGIRLDEVAEAVMINLELADVQINIDFRETEFSLSNRTLFLYWER